MYFIFHFILLFVQSEEKNAHKGNPTEATDVEESNVDDATLDGKDDEDDVGSGCLQKLVVEEEEMDRQAEQVDGQTVDISPNGAHQSNGVVDDQREDVDDVLGVKEGQNKYL